MSTDLHSALRGIADGVEAAASGPQEDVLVARLRRGRMVRRASYGVAGAAAAGALVLGGGLLLDRWPGPVPPATPPATEQPSPEPTTEPSPTTGPSPTTEPSPTVEPTPDPTPAARPPLEDVVVSTSGLGPLRLGPVPTTGPGAAMIRVSPVACTDESLGTRDLLVSAYDDGTEQRTFWLDGYDGVITWITVISPEPRAAEGLGLGSSVAELQAAYPELEGPFTMSEGEDWLSRVWWVRGADGTLVFETSRTDAEFVPQDTERVLLMQILAPDRDPRFTAMWTDNVPGSC